MKNILVLHTGGTIAMSNDENGTAPTENNPLNAFTKQFSTSVNLTVENPFNIPSPHVGPKEMLQLQKRIKQAITQGFNGVVITHGTDTLEETAYFLDLTIPESISIVITGAMRSANDIGSDGLHNYQTAIMTAASDEAVGKGVLVVMNDEVHTARYVTKTHTTNVATFRTPTFGPIGLILNNGVKFFEQLITHTSIDIDDVVNHVYLIKAYAGMDAELLESIANTKTNGVVIEALGAGNMPPQTLPAIQKLIDLNIPVIIVSRSFNGIAQDIYSYEGGGVQLKRMGAIFCHGLNGQKARIKLLVGLSAKMTRQQLINFVDDPIS